MTNIITKIVEQEEKIVTLHLQVQESISAQASTKQESRNSVS